MTQIKEFKQFEQEMHKITEAYDDFGLSKHGIELDRDDDGDGKEFKAKRMFDQLGKVIDSRSNPNPIGTVTTDDGDEVQVTPTIAHMIRGLEIRTTQQGGAKEKFMRMIQTTNGLKKVIDLVKSKA
jgi:hypothetical protein|tara:strand:- start:9749 stop:10126 length:378 start_codon:yes stop_codon:yes gene_type:complete